MKKLLISLALAAMVLSKSAKVGVSTTSQLRTSALS